MNKKIRKTVSVLAAALMLTIFSAVPAMAYTTDYYDIDVTVGEDNSYQVREYIQVDFDRPQRGIFRYIPIYDEDGRKVMKIQDVDTADVPHKIYEENYNTVIRLGDEDTYVTGVQNYEISYLARVYDDGDASSDLLYYDLLPTGWETPIDSCYISVELPKPIDKEAITIYADAYGIADVHENVYWSYDSEQRKIFIEARNLPQGTGITVYAPLDEGYWVGQLNRNWAKPLWLIFLLAAPLGLFFWWLRKGRDPKFVKTVEFYPPRGMTPAEVGYLYDGSIDNRDMGAMIVYLAEKGYLRLQKEEESMRAYPCAEPEGEKPFVQQIYKGIFEGRSPEHGVNLSSASSGLASACRGARQTIKETYSGDFAPMDRGGKLRQLGSMLVLLTGHLLALLFLSLYSRELSPMGLELVILPMLFFGVRLGITVNQNYHSTGKVKNLLKIALSGILVFLAASCTFTAVKWNHEDIRFGVLFGALTVVSAGMVIFMDRRNPAQTRVLGQIFGLRNFIEKAELAKLNLLVEENPSYFYDILPYAYVLGLTEKWIEQFESIVIEPAPWYSSDDDIMNRLYWINMMNTVDRVRSYPKTSVSASSTSSSRDSGGTSYSSGGGFSGGGHGGGGGGAW